MRPEIDLIQPLVRLRTNPQASGRASAELAALLAACARADPRAFAQLYTLVAPRLRRCVMRLTSQHDIVDDIVQESLIAIWRQAHTYEFHHASPMTWMSAIVRHKTFDHFRAQRVRANADDHFFFDCTHEENIAHSPCSLLESRQRTSEVARCLHQLLATQRQAIELAYMQELTHEEVAAKLQKPLGTVKTWIRRGVLDLRRQMGSRRCHGAQRVLPQQPLQPGLACA
ncbi:RNA polymerase sigma factor [Massilia sp. PAMC28688]|uniref:RNA polymerase sigma factor n=1 Tax=Massilia sp. PAMC28688 TaxID=2861283 RepID=UPI001C637E7B|nr:RNA polymerase sigma factor [Massilia sp. PAMC28688]QYF92233.1 RNA polymerase sigma factor [Massilia sp. PAMC28688]